MMQRSLLKPRVDEDLCVGCGICAGACPSGAIEVRGKAEIDLSKCIACGNCVRACPQGAIKLTPTPVIELSAARGAPVIRESNQERLRALGNRVEALSSQLDDAKEEIRKLKEMGRI